MKKIIVVLLSFLLLMLSACGQSSTSSNSSSNSSVSTDPQSNNTEAETVTVGEFNIKLPDSWHVDEYGDGVVSITTDSSENGGAVIGILEAADVSIQNEEELETTIKEFILDEGMDISDEFYVESSIDAYAYVGMDTEDSDVIMAIAVADSVDGLLVMELVCREEEADACLDEFDTLLSGISVNADSTQNNQAIMADESDEDDAEEIEVAQEYEVGAGYYTAGIDLPVGKMNISVISGDGNVSSSNMFSSGGINEMMGISDSSLYIDAFNGVKMDAGVVLEVSGNLQLKIEYTDIKAAHAGREYDENNIITLGSGNYDIGSDIPAGIYIIEAISGAGTVSSSNLFDGGINEMMADSSSAGQYSGLYTEKVVNVDLPEGETLEVGGLEEIRLTPAK